MLCKPMPVDNCGKIFGDFAITLWMNAVTRFMISAYDLHLCPRQWPHLTNGKAVHLPT